MSTNNSDKYAFCVYCGGKMPLVAAFCPFCGKKVPAPTEPSANEPKAPAPKPKDRFYVFAVQGPAFGSVSGDVVLEKAQKLQGEFDPDGNTELVLVRPSMWSARVQSGGGNGFVSVSYSLSTFRAEIEKYLRAQNVPDGMIERGLSASEEKSLQLSNPMSGVFVMGVPLIAEAEKPEAAAEAVPEAEAPTEEAPAVPAPCEHKYEHFVCVKCGEKAPKPVLISDGVEHRGQYTYEYYRAQSAEEARYFLEQTEVALPLYYVMIHTPEGTWGRDKDGIFLESLCAFQHDLSLAQCEASAALFPERIQDLQMAAQNITDNYLTSVTCGSCGHTWKDGVAYRAKTVVKCPVCGKYNVVDTENVRINSL